MESSFTLLSSMSPKVTKTLKPYVHQKGPKLLSLKKNLRRSSAIEGTCLQARYRPSIIVIESSSESENSLDSEVKIHNKTVIVVPDSDNSESEGEPIQNNQLSKSKFVTITDWVKNVNTEQFSSPKDKIVYNFDDVLTSLPEIDAENPLSNSISSKSDSCDSSNKFNIDILNELYCDTWKNLRDEVLTRSTPRRKRDDDKLNQLSKTEVNSKIRTDNLKTPASPWTNILKGLCDSDVPNENSKSVKKPIHKLSFNSDEDSSSTTSKCSYKKPYSNRDSLSDLSDQSKNCAKTKPTTAKKNATGTAKSKVVTAKKNTNKKTCGLKNTTKDNERREPHSLERHVTDECVWKITPIKEKHDSGTIKSFLASLSGSVKMSQCDPAARIFRGNFKGYKDELLNRLFKLYNDKVFDNKLPEDILFEWNDRMRGTAGFCYCRIVTRRTGIVERKARIVLSSKVIDSCDRLRDTLIHELCHAATWIINEVANGHGDFWKAWASKASRSFPELPPIKRCHDYVINTKYTYRCMDCGYSIGRHSKSLDVERKRCGYCYGKFEILLNKTSKDGETKSVPVTPKKAVSGFALFVKEHYAVYKTPQLNHGQVMKLLGQKFNEAKVSL